MNKKAKKFIVVFFFLFLISASIVQANNYFYLNKDNEFKNYLFDINSRLLPFEKYNSYYMCKDNFPSQKISETEVLYPEITVKNIEKECQDLFLYRIINFIRYNKGNITVIYNSFSESDYNVSINFSNAFNLTYLPDYRFDEAKENIILIGYFKENTENSEIGKNNADSIVYVKENENSSIIGIIGSEENKTKALAQKLINIYNSDFIGNPCVITNGCEVSETIELENVLLDIKDFLDNKKSISTIIETIKNWIKY